MCRYPVGTLTAKNILSLVRFLSKIAITESPKAGVAGQILRQLSDQGFIKAHQSNLSSEQLDA